MRARNWDHGDVALVNGHVCMMLDGKWVHGSPDSFDFLAYDPSLDVRPLAVIDPGPGTKPALEVINALRVAAENDADTAEPLAWLADQFEAQLAPPGREVYEHFLDPSHQFPDGKPKRSICGKLWNSAQGDVVVGKCPECASLVNDGWSA